MDVVWGKVGGTGEAECTQQQKCLIVAKINKSQIVKTFFFFFCLSGNPVLRPLV